MKKMRYILRSAAVYVAIVTVSLLVSLYAIEGWLSLTLDRRSFLAVLDVERAKRPDAVFSIPPISILNYVRSYPELAAKTGIGSNLLPMSGIADARTVLCRERGREDYGTVVISTDEHGFNNPKGLWSGQADVVVLGDSFAHGYCVPEGRDITQPLRANFPRTLNLGMTGMGPLGELAILEEFGLAQSPKHVLWLFYPNDVSNLVSELQEPLFARYAVAGGSQALMQREPEVQQKLRQFHDLLLEKVAPDLDKPVSLFKDVLLLRQLRTQLDLALTASGGPVELGELDEPQLRAILARAKSETEAVGGKFHFVYLPGREEIFAPTDAHRRQRDRVLATARGVGADVIDVTKAFQDYGNFSTLFLCLNCHYSIEGYLVAGNYISSQLH